MQCSLATGHVPPEFFPVPLYGELRSHLPPEARVSMLAIMLYAADVTPWSWAMREPDWLLGHDPDVVTAQRIGYAADKAAHEMLFSVALVEAIEDARQFAASNGYTLIDTEEPAP